MNVLDIFVLFVVGFASCYIYSTYGPIAKLEQLQNVHLTSTLYGITLLDIMEAKSHMIKDFTTKTGFFVENIKDYPNSPHTFTFKKYIENYFKNAKHFFDKVPFSLDEYLYFYYCTFKNIFIEDGYKNEITFLENEFVVYGFKVPETCDLLCNKTRSRMPCAFESQKNREAFDYPTTTVKLMKIAHALSKTVNAFKFPQGKIDEVNERWDSIPQKYKDDNKKDLKAVDGCIMINKDSFFTCSFDDIVFGPKKSERLRIG